MKLTASVLFFLTALLFATLFVQAQVAATREATLSTKPDTEGQPYLIATSYYPWYTVERWNHQECVAGTLREELVPPQTPMLGRYDSRSQDVVTQHILWSAGAGVNVWALEWIRPDDFIDQTLRNVILTSPRIGDMKFAIFYDYAIRFNGDLMLTPEKINTIVSDFAYLAYNYFSHPSYLKVLKERPAVFFYLTRALNPLSRVIDMASAIRTAVSNLGFDLYIIGDEYFALNPPNAQRIGIWDGIFGYDVYMRYAGYSDDNGYLERHRTRHAEYETVTTALGVDFIPSLAPGYNDRAVRRTCANNPALARRASADAPEGSLFLNFLRDIALPHASKSRLRMIHITSFNEWHEDTQIEPTIVTKPTTRDTSPTGNQYTQDLIYQGYGTLYLDIIREQVRAIQQMGDSTVPLGLGETLFDSRRVSPKPSSEKP